MKHLVNISKKIRQLFVLRAQAFTDGDSELARKLRQDTIEEIKNSKEVLTDYHYSKLKEYVGELQDTYATYDKLW